MSLPSLSPDQFPRFFEAVHGYPPFLWQSRLAAEVITTNEWPRAVSLPTSAGKTALIDIAVFALAAGAHLPPPERRAPLRIFFVIDRRVVADEAFGRAKKLERALREMEEGQRTDRVLKIVAARLQHLAGEGAAPLSCALLRGGIGLDDDWIRSPLQPTVCVSTADQVGSRLLFRGYGVAPRQRPMHAAMIAHDSLLIVDEAHISQPFCETVANVQRFARQGEASPIRPLRLVEMTATPQPGVTGFSLLAKEAAEPELARRISANKPAALEAVAQTPDERNQAALIARAVALAETWGKEETRVIGIVVNRVLTARRIFDALDESIGEKALFIGRIRSLDRDRLWQKWRSRLTSDPRERVPAERTIFIVATQTIEVGADLDFDALISELAPLNSLRQRFGRLNRRGRAIDVKACVIASKEQIGTRYDDPVYGKTLAPTWKWLQAQLEGRGRGKSVNFAHTNLEARLGVTDAQIIKELSVTTPTVPLLHRSYVNAWACTPAPLMHDPDVAPFLHGEQPPELEVQIVWRADLDESVFARNDDRPGDFDQRLAATLDLIDLLPPSSREALPVPLPSAIRWLQQLASLELSDTANSRDAEPKRQRSIRAAIIWRSKDEVRLTRTRAAIRPGDVLIVPNSYGGADEFGWIGSSAQPGPVPDIAEEAAWDAKRAPFMRLHAGVLAQNGTAPPRDFFRSVENEESEETWPDWLATLADVPEPANRPAHWRERVAFFRGLDPAEVEVIRNEFYPGAILRSRVAVDPLTALWADDGNDEASQTASRTQRVLLKNHLSQVADLARRFASLSGLPEPLVSTISRAAELHDVGKADPRTQVIFFGSEPPAFAAVKSGELLAKSSHRFTTKAAYRQLLQLAGLPTGARHETLSVFLAANDPNALSGVEDEELALHLIAAHHGFARPLLRPLSLPDAEPDTVDLHPLGLNYSGPTSYDAASFASAVPERFIRLQQHYGWWGLAWLETLLRLADWSQSAAEQRNPSRHE